MIKVRGRRVDGSIADEFESANEWDADFDAGYVDHIWRSTKQVVKIEVVRIEDGNETILRTH